MEKHHYDRDRCLYETPLPYPDLFFSPVEIRGAHNTLADALLRPDFYYFGTRI